MRTFGHAVFAAAALAIFSAGAAHAHTPFILPADFTPDDGAASVNAAFASQFFAPTIALDPNRFTALDPNGVSTPYTSVRIEQLAARLQFPLYDRGTYRLSSGEILGPVTQMIAADGGWRAMAPGEVPPEGVQTNSLQTVTSADAYISRGRPNDTVLSAASGRLAIQPITHPNRISVADGLTLQLNFDGAPFPNMPFVLYASGDADTDVDTTFVTGADGRAVIRFPAAGQYVIAVRHRANAPAGSEAAVRSYTTTLTVEVFDVLPPMPPEVQEPRDRRRQRDNRSRL